MFNIPVISSSSRFSPDSSGMMHLNALNASLSSSPSSTRRASSSSSCSNCLPSYEEAVSNGPLFGLFNLNGGDTSTRHHHRHHHHHHHHQQQQQQQQQQQRRYHQQYHDVQNNNSNNSNNTVQHHIHFPQSYHGPSNNNDDSYSVPTYQEVLSPGGSGRESSKSPNSRASSRMESRDDNAASRLEGEALEERLSRMALSEGSKSTMLKSVPKTPRESKRRHDHEKLSIPTCSRKDGNGNDGKQKQTGAEKSTLSVAKDKIFRVFSPMLSRKSDRHRSASAKPFSRKTPISSTEDENSEEEKTSLPLRMCVAPSRDKNSHVDHFDNLKGQRSKQPKKKKVPHKRCHRTKQYHENF